MAYFAFVLIICTVCFYINVVDATVCKPLSAFKIDCDECICSVSGREYTCYSRECKPTIKRRPFNPNDIPIDLRASNDIPYINDEIPNSRESFENKFEDIDYEDSDREFQSVDSNEDASLFDTGYPASEYRYKRSLKPLPLKNTKEDKNLH